MDVMDANKVPIAAAQPVLSKEEQAKGIMYKYMWGNAVLGLLPIPIIDMLAVGGVQLAMLSSISKIYEIPFSKNIVKEIVGALISCISYDVIGREIWMGLTKFFPGVGTLAGLATFPVLSAATTFAVGKIFIQHFESGGTFLDFDPSKVKAYYAQYYKEGLEVAQKISDSKSTQKPPAQEVKK